MNANFDQTKLYDFAGQLRKNDVGNSGATYYQNINYDEFGNVASRSTKAYSFTPNGFSATYVSNRKTSGGAATTYDVAGNAVYQTREEKIEEE